MASSSSASSGYQVFVSFAGEDEKTIAYPLKDMLRKKGIRAFVSNQDILHGSDSIMEITSAMQKANIAVIVLSPEFVANKWPMKELQFLLNRQWEESRIGNCTVVILPVFYRLTKEDIVKEPVFTRMCDDGTSLYDKTGFLKRMSKNEPEANVERIQTDLQILRRIRGVENEFCASNGDEELVQRQLLLNRIVNAVSQRLNSTQSSDENEAPQYTLAQALHNHVLDFTTKDEHGKPLKHRILALDASQGINGVVFRSPSVNTH